jgi:hypothetical protein
MLEEELKLTICSEYRRMLIDGVGLHHDNVQSHTAAWTIEMIQKLKCTFLHHPVYIPDLVPFNYHIFGPLKNVLHGCQFVNDKEFKVVVHMWLCM